MLQMARRRASVRAQIVIPPDENNGFMAGIESQTGLLMATMNCRRVTKIEQFRGDSSATLWR
jgi:hypothetical protein